MSNSEDDKITIPESPAEIFVALWRHCSNLTSHQRLVAAEGPADFVSEVFSALSENNVEIASERLNNLVNIAFEQRLSDQRNGRLLAIMRCIDKFYYSIHPRSGYVTFKPVALPPEWLADSRDMRLIQGCYHSFDGFSLVPKGPLLRSARDEIASNAENFADRFAALSITANSYALEERMVDIKRVIVGMSVLRGVRRAANAGTESIGFIPIAEAYDQVTMSERVVGSQPFVDFKLSPTLDAAEMISRSLNAMGFVDIAIAPEFLVSEFHAEKIPDCLKNQVGDRPRMLLAGSGKTVDVDLDGLAWNETQVFNGLGAELWRQRKIWPAGLSAERASQYGLKSTPGKLVMEDTAEGNAVVVADVDGFGRCIVLICQDLEARPLADDLIRDFQPDWVLTPIMDSGVSIGRWAHQRAFSLSSLSNARFLVASSTSLAKWHPPRTFPSCGLAVGPKSPIVADGDTGRVCIEVKAQGLASERYATVKWRSGNWGQTNLGSNISD